MDWRDYKTAAPTQPSPAVDLRTVVNDARRHQRLLAELRRQEAAYSTADFRRKNVITSQMRETRDLILLLTPGVCPKCVGTGKIALYIPRGVKYVPCKSCLTPYEDKA